MKGAIAPDLIPWLNNALAIAQPNSTDGAAIWAKYLRDWTFWNHVRTIASLVATAIFAIDLRTRSS